MPELIDIHTLRALLRYEPETGKLFWEPRTPNLFGSERYSAERICKAWNAKNAGREAFTSKNAGGYHNGAIFGETYLAHRVIWAMETGKWPVNEVDHKDRDQGNNRWHNLREANRNENCRNASKHDDCTSRFIGVSWNVSAQKWRSYITVNSQQIHLGFFECEVAAAHAHDKAAFENHGPFANPNFAEIGQ